MMNKKNYIYFILSVLLFSGCYDDIGNTTYNLVTEAKVEGIQDTYLLNLGDRWQIETDLTYTMDKPSDVAYHWIVNGDTIADTQNLDVIVAFPLKNNMVSEFVVTDLNNKTQTIVPFRVSVQSEFKRGWIILSETPDHSELSYIRADDLRFYNNIYAEINKENLSKGGLFVKEHFLDPLIFLNTGQVFVACTEAPGYSIDLDGDSFSKVISTKDEFVGEMPKDFHPENYESISAFAGMGVGCDYLISNGELYTRSLYDGGAYQDGLYTNFPYNFDGNDYHLSPWLIKGHEIWGRYLIGFDEVSKSFVKLEDSEFQKFDSSSDFGAGLSMKNTDLELLDGGLISYYSDMSGEPDRFLAFMINNKQEIEVLKFGIDPFGIIMMGSFFYMTESKKPLLDSEGAPVSFGSDIINDNTNFAFVSKGSSVYIASENKLYSYDHGSGTLKMLRVYDKKISYISTNRTNYQELGIAFDNENGTSEFCIADVSYLGGGKIISEAYQISGVVKDILYKVGEIMNIEGIL